MKNIVAGLLCFLLLGCSIPPLTKTAIRQEPYMNVTGKSLTISVKKMVNAIELGKTIGKVYGGNSFLEGYICLYRGDLGWTGSEKLMNKMTNNARKKLEQYGYSIITDELSKQSDLLLGSKIVDVESNACYSPVGTKGATYVKVEWELYDTKKRKVILTLATEGYSSVDSFDESEGFTKYFNAFDMAVDNLLAAKEFYGLLTAGK